MSWCKYAKEALSRGEKAIIHPKGNSMRPLVESGQRVALEPITDETLTEGDIVLVRVRGRDYLHLIKATRPGQVLIGNNRGGINGWTHVTNVFGKAVEIGDTPV